MRFKKSPQLLGAERTRAWHHHGSDTPTSPRAMYVLKSAKGQNIFWGECTLIYADVTLFKDGSEHNFIFSFTIY